MTSFHGSISLRSIHGKPVIVIPLIRKEAQGYNFQQGTKINQSIFYIQMTYGRSKPELETLTNTTRIFTRDAEMKLGLQKCATLVY